MARNKGSANLAASLEVLAGAPLDAREVVQAKADLTASGSFPYKYIGMEVYVVAENKKYRLIANDPTDLASWEEVGSGGGDPIQVDTLPTASADELGNIYQYVGVSDANYTNGCFYECVSDGEATPTYSWEMKPVMPSLEASDMADIVTPLPTGGRVTGFTPIGTIIPMIAETAPLYYLKCDGATYNKSDYPELAAHLLSMTNHSMYEVSGDSTKFKVPDLSGEFLRGTGTNGHANQGSGANVGVHQDSSNVFFPKSGLLVGLGSDDAHGLNSDGLIYQSQVGRNTINPTSSDTNGTMYTIRPTNTSVLYCIATKDIYIDARNIYSTTEKVVGEWIDGKPLYQKTIVDTMPTITTDGVFAMKFISASFLEDVDMVVNISTIKNWNTDYFGQITDAYINLNAGNPDNQPYFTRVYASKRDKAIVVGGNRTGFSENPIYITIQYTKATT